MTAETTLDSLVKGKDVLLVGNSGVLNDLQYGSMIDSYECVIRFNHAIAHLTPETTGTKTDIWIFAMVNERLCADIYRKAKHKPSVMMRYGASHCIINGEQSLLFDSRKPKQELKKSLGLIRKKIPSTGVVIMNHLVSECNQKSLSIIGFDSFANANFYTNINANKKFKWHDGEIEMKFVSDLVSKGRIRRLQ